MIVFWILFLLVILISGFLAYLSMKDFREEPQDFSSDNCLFLIRKPHVLTPKLFDWLHINCERDRVIVSLERLFKGGESALTLYGPKKILVPLVSSLDLIELEDYVREEIKVSVWEIGVRNLKHNRVEKSLFSDFPKLGQSEEVWYQIVLQAQKGESKKFIAQIRVMVLISDEHRKKEVSGVLQVQKGPLIKIPQKFSSLQMMDFYRKRSMIGRDQLKLTGEEIAKLWNLPNL